MLLSAFIWLFSGKIEDSLSIYAYSDKNISLAFVDIDEISKIKSGMNARLDNQKASVNQVFTKTMSYNQMSYLVGEENLLAMKISDVDRKYMITFSIDNPPEGLVNAVIILDVLNPASFLLR